MNIYAWADGFWCHEEELEECSQGRSDDTLFLHVDDDADDESIDIYVHQAVNRRLK